MRRLDEKHDSVRLHLLVPPSLVAKVDRWRKKQSNPPNRSDAIRQLVMMSIEPLKQQEAKESS